MDALLEQMLEAPDLPRKLQTLNDAFAREQACRERFYEEMTPYQKVEFINGEVVMHSPARLEHSKTASLLSRLLSIYVDRRNLGFVGFEKVLVSLTRNDYEPDIVFFGTEKEGKFVAGQMKFPAPDLAVEILSPSSEKRDRQIKKQDYAAHGVSEYWIVDAEKQLIEQYQLEDAEYRLLGIRKIGETIISLAVPGFSIPVLAAFDAEANVAVLAGFFR